MRPIRPTVLPTSSKRLEREGGPVGVRVCVGARAREKLLNRSDEVGRTDRAGTEGVAQ